MLESIGQMVTKDTLMRAVWPDTHVTDDSLVQCISEIRKALGTQANCLVTVPKRGYRLDAPTTVTDQGKSLENKGRFKKHFTIMAIAFGLCLMLVSVFFWDRLHSPNNTNSQSLAVLPFTLLSDKEEDRYLSNGIAEDLIASLVRVTDIRMVSRNTAAAVAQPGSDPRQTASFLKVDHLLEGSVRRSGEQLHLTASLVDGQTGNVLWSDQFEGTSSDLFAFEKAVLEGLLRTLTVRLSATERKKLGVQGTKNIEAHELLMKGRELENRFTQAENERAEALLREAIQLDPEFGAAYAHLSLIYSYRIENGWSAAPKADIQAAFDAANRAIDLDDALPFAHFALARLYSRSYASDPQKAIDSFKRAVDLDHNYVDAKMFLANMLIFTGQANQSMPIIKDSFERNPLPPFWYFQALGMAQYFLKDFESAEKALTQARDQNPTAPFPHRFLIATYGQLGQSEDADWSMMEYEELGRKATIDDIMKSASIVDTEYRQALRAGLENAGLPEN